MPINVDRMRKDKEEAQQGGPGYAWPVGDTNTYLLPPPEDYEVPYTEYAIHRVGPSGQTVLCFNPKKNKILTNPKFLEFAKERGIKIPKVCEPCAQMDSEDLWNKNRDEAIRKSAKMRGVFLIIPWTKRASSKEDWSEISPKRVYPFFAPKDQWDEILDWFMEMYDKELKKDVTDFDQARLFRLNRVGTGQATRYSAGGDTSTIQKPLVLSKDVRAIVMKALADPENCYERLVAYHVLVSPEEVAALMQGVATDKVANDGGGDAGGDDAVKVCLGNPELFNPNDPECSKTCRLFQECKAAVEAAGKGGGKTTKAPEPEPEPEQPPLKLEDLPLTGTVCSLCMQLQRSLPDGTTVCAGEHVGAPAFVPKAPPSQSPASAPAAPSQAASGNSRKLDELLRQRGQKAKT